MTNRILPILLALLVGILATVFLLTGDDAPDPEDLGEAALTPGIGGEALVDNAPSGPGELAPAVAPRTDDGVAAVPASFEEERREASTPYDLELAEAHWVEGRLVFPEGTPIDEEVWVVAAGKDFEHGPQHRAPVAADGSFRVALSKASRSGKIDVEARYLHLDSPVKVRTKKLEPIVVEPHLGGVLTGRVVPPADAPFDVAQIVGARVRMRGWRESSGDWKSISRSTEIQEDLTYTLEAVPALFEFYVEVDLEGFEPATAEDLRVGAGEVREHIFELAVGVTVEGVVVDESGTPLEGIRVEADSEGGSWFGGDRHGMTDAQGRFRIAGIKAGDLEVSATKKGYEDASVELEDLPDRHVEGGIRLVLDRGQFISGRVLWEDGTPAAKAVVKASKDGERSWRGGFFGDDVFRSESDGTFLVSGLDEGKYRLDAHGTITEVVPVKSELTGRIRDKKKKVVLRAAQEDIPVGTQGVELVLTRGRFIGGVVTDDLGASLERFHVVARRRIKNDDWWRTADEIAELFRDTSGAFEVGLQPGRWELRIRAKGHKESETQTIEVPYEGPDLVFRLDRTATIEGRVVSHRGAPVRGAVVDVSKSAGRSYFGWNDQEDKTDQDGRFELEDIPSGSVTLIARAPGHASSPEVVLDVAPGEALRGIEIALSMGATLVAEVRDANGRPIPYRTVEASNRDARFGETYQTNADGVFEATGLPAGTLNLESFPTDQEIQALTGKGTAEGARSAQSLLRIEEDVELLDGQTTRVVLQPPRLSIIRLTGRVTGGGEVLDDVYVSANVDSEEDLPWVRDETDNDGEFVLLLPGAGETDFSFRCSEYDFQLYLTELVPDRGQVRMDFDLPMGSVSGRLYGPDGEPLANTEVDAFSRHEDGTPHVNAEVDTDDDGRFVFEMLPAGTYSVRCEGDSVHDDELELEGGSLGDAEVEGVVVGANAKVKGIDLRLPLAGTITGTVYASDGTPASRAQVRLSWTDSEGTFRSETDRTSRQGGTFRFPGLESGSYVLTAVHGTEVTLAGVTVEVIAGESFDTRLETAPGTTIVVHTQDSAGNDIEAWVTSVDQDGRRHSGSKDVSKTFWEIGPLPVGTYTVRGSDTDQNKLTPQTVTITGDDPTVTITLTRE